MRHTRRRNIRRRSDFRFSNMRRQEIDRGFRESLPHHLVPTGLERFIFLAETFQPRSRRFQFVRRIVGLLALPCPLRLVVFSLCLGKSLTMTGTLVNDGATLLYRGSVVDCGQCQFKARCCPNTPARRIPRSLYEGARDLARLLADTPAFEQSRCERKKVEMLFAHLKRILRLDRLRLRGPQGARTEFLLAATAQTSGSSQS
jgi:hypothetical protein